MLMGRKSWFWSQPTPFLTRCVFKKVINMFKGDELTYPIILPPCSVTFGEYSWLCPDPPVHPTLQPSWAALSMSTRSCQKGTTKWNWMAEFINICDTALTQHRYCRHLPWEGIWAGINPAQTLHLCKHLLNMAGSAQPVHGPISQHIPCVSWTPGVLCSGWRWVCVFHI